MKSKEVIRRLQELDPTGDTEVCVGNQDILFIEEEEAYYDGCLEVLLRNEALKDCYNVTGVKYEQEGRKISISPHGAQDVLSDNPEAIIDYSALGEATAARYRERDEKRRADTRRMFWSIEFQLFFEWARTLFKLCLGHFDESKLLHSAEEFFNNFLSYKDPLPDPVWEVDEKSGLRCLPSYNDRRKRQWSSTLRITYKQHGEEFMFERIAPPENKP